MSFLTDDSNEAFASIAPPAPPAIQLDLLPAVASRTVRNFSFPTFQVVMKEAIEQGLVSKQSLGERFGVDVLSMLRKERNPDPATCREILTFISELDPKDAIGVAHNWKHKAQEKDAASYRISRNYTL